MQRRFVLCLVVLLVASTAGAATAGATGGAVPASGPSVSPPAQTTPDGFTNTAFEIRVYANGSAQWTVRHSTPLNDSERAQFEEYADRFENRTTGVYDDFQVRAQRLTGFGTNATGREMSATAFSRRAGIQEFGPRGFVEMSFRWTNFAQVDGERVVAGDIFQGGMYIRADQRLVLARGPGLRFVSVSPDPDSQEIPENLTASETVSWLGGTNGTTFANERPRAALLPPGQLAADGGDATPPTDGEPTATENGTGAGAGSGASSDGDGADGGFGPLAFVVALVLLVGVGGGIAWYSGALRGLSTPGDDGDGAAAVEADTSETERTADAAEPAVPDEGLLSDEDRVLELLESNGGRMKQVNIVEETEWSKSKVSMLLSDMEEEGDISKLRVGRENIISISGEEPDAVGSPFDDE
jgi:hypothetical protein